MNKAGVMCEVTCTASPILWRRYIETEAKKRLDFGTGKDCLVAEDMYHQVLASVERNRKAVDSSQSLLYPHC
jgi:hypothetical protein